MTAAAAPVRLVMFSALVCSLFAFTAYGAKIVSILQAPSAALQTIDDLARSPLALAVQNTTYRRVYFAVSLLFLRRAHPTTPPSELNSSHRQPTLVHGWIYNSPDTSLFNH